MSKNATETTKKNGSESKPEPTLPPFTTLTEIDAKALKQATVIEYQQNGTTAVLRCHKDIEVDASSDPFGEVKAENVRRTREIKIECAAMPKGFKTATVEFPNRDNVYWRRAIRLVRDGSGIRFEITPADGTVGRNDHELCAWVIRDQKTKGARPQPNLIAHSAQMLK